MSKRDSVKAKVKGRSIELRPSDLVQSGGEGSVFRKGQLAYKVYHESTKMIPPAKIQELGRIKDKNVIRPMDMIVDNSGKPIGYTMTAVGSRTALCELFTTAFRDRNGVTPEKALELVDALKEGISRVHEAKCLVVDCNELNFLVEETTYTTPYFIDVDSYQTPSFNATAIMPSIHDVKSGNHFSEVTDWYSFGVLACQLFVGMHPYKGKHPKYKRQDMAQRIIEGVSIFNKYTRVPPATRDFSLIPKNYMDWFVKMFEGGDRLPPPGASGQLVVKQIKPTIVESGDHFVVDLIRQYKADVVGFWTWRGKTIVQTKKQVFIDGSFAFETDLNSSIVFSPTSQEPFVARVEHGELTMNNKEYSIAGKERLVVDNTLYLKKGDSLFEIMLVDMGGCVKPLVKASWPVMRESGRVFRGLVIQEMLGEKTFVMPRPVEGTSRSSCSIKLIPELRDYRIIDAKRDGQVVVVRGEKQGKSAMFILRFNEAYESYDIRKEKDCGDINFTVLDNGIVIMIREDGVLEVFFNQANDQKMKSIKDPQIDNGMRLASNGTQCVFFKGDRVYGLKMK